MKVFSASLRSLSWISLAFLLLFAVPVLSQDPAAATKLSGTWQVKMALPTGEKPGESGEKIYTLEVEGADKVSIRSPGQGELKVTDVLVSGGDLQIYFNYSPVKGEPGNSVELKGALNEKGNLAGTWQFLVTGQSGAWTAVGEGNAGGPAAGNVALVKAQKDTGAAVDDEVAPAEVEKDEESASADEAVPVAEGEKAAAPEAFVERLPVGYGGRSHDHEGGKVFVERSQSVGEPGSETGAARTFRASLEEGDGRIMIDGIGVHRLYEAEAVGNAGGVGHEFADPGPGLAVLLEVES